MVKYDEDRLKSSPNQPKRGFEVASRRRRSPLRLVSAAEIASPPPRRRADGPETRQNPEPKAT